MIQFTIKTANKTIGIATFFENTKEYCKEYLCDEEPDFSIEITQADIEFEREIFTKRDEKEGNPVRNYSAPYLETIAVQRKITEKLFEYDTVLFHGSVIAVDGVAYMFTAKSGTGKSTHTRLWREMLGERAVMVNDDKPFISVKGGDVVVHGSPWNGKHKIGNNISVPLRAICIIERGEDNEIEPILPSKAIQMLFQQSSRPKNASLMPKYLELLDGIACGVSFYRLRCNMDPTAARISYNAMSGETQK